MVFIGLCIWMFAASNLQDLDSLIILSKIASACLPSITSGISKLELTSSGKEKVLYEKAAPNTSNTGISLK